MVDGQNPITAGSGDGSGQTHRGRGHEGGEMMGCGSSLYCMT